MLRSLLSLPSDLHHAPIATAVAEALMRRRKERGWRWTTTIKQLACAQGALASLPLYRDTTYGLLLKKYPTWVHSLRAAARNARKELPRQPKAATWLQVKMVLDSEPSLPVFVAILLAWSTSARTGCILQLMKSDITWHDSCLSVCFRRGKGALLRGTAYTVHTGPIPMSYASRLRSWMEARRTWLFPKEVKGHLLRNALRRADPALEQRSLRRGSLQLLASVTGITDETLLLFSGHSSVKTLRRYLNWGVKANRTRTTMANVGGMLMSAQQPPVNPQDG